MRNAFTVSDGWVHQLYMLIYIFCCSKAYHALLALLTVSLPDQHWCKLCTIFPLNLSAQIHYF